jgi:hypothetical protein
MLYSAEKSQSKQSSIRQPTNSTTQPSPAQFSPAQHRAHHKVPTKYCRYYLQHARVQSQPPAPDVPDLACLKASNFTTFCSTHAQLPIPMSAEASASSSRGPRPVQRLKRHIFTPIHDQCTVQHLCWNSRHLHSDESTRCLSPERPATYHDTSITKHSIMLSQGMALESILCV